MHHTDTDEDTDTDTDEDTRTDDNAAGAAEVESGSSNSGVEAKDQERRRRPDATVILVSRDVMIVPRQKDDQGQGEAATKVEPHSLEKTTDDTAGAEVESGSSESGVEAKNQERRKRADSTVILVSGDIMIVPTDKNDPHSLETNNASEEKPTESKPKGVGPRINIDLDIVSAMARHPFRALVASPLLFIAGTSFAVFTVSALLCEVIARLGEDSDEKKRSVSQDEEKNSGSDEEKRSVTQDEEKSSGSQP